MVGASDGEYRPLPGGELLNAMFYGLDAGVLVVDSEARILVVNPRASEITRLAQERFLGADLHDLLHREEDGSAAPRDRCPLLAALRAGVPTRTQGAWFRRGDGSLLRVGWLMAPYLVTGERAGAVVTFFDLSEQEEEARRRDAHLAALRRRAERLSLVSEITTVLTSTLDMREALRRLVRLVAPRLGDWAVVDLLGEQEEVVRVAVVHYENGTHVNVAELEGRLPDRVSWESRSPLQRVLRGAPALFVGPEHYAGEPDSAIQGAQKDLFRTTGMHAAVIAPLRGGRGVMGALTVGRADQEQPFDREDLALVDDIARRAGLAVDNAQLYDRQRRVSETMQLHLLTPLPRVPGLAMAARYLPAPEGSQVGGDWYDAFVLPDGAATLVIGDVIGHDLQAAANMSQVRNMLRAFAWDVREPPCQIVDRLDRALVTISDAPMATLVLCHLERGESGPWQLTWHNAGHPPPLLIPPEGAPRFLEEGHGLLLGTQAENERTNATVPLPADSTLVLYTDGLVEAPGQPLDTGLERLRGRALELAGRPLGEFCDRLLAEVAPEETADDIALLVVRAP
ncbi:SpoIIE family protein phosphatase [Streptomyces zingiberis]|uniref:SpoIIE family protein phosphatase n=1 Tax=Streptomyces zingiberis TaxID=2053010 RepID=A0ABX1C1C4_9ACTN|nr:SpoIIE family protein phosphatase [Streptomyces zingiberis]NJQ02465.1 SpoIIE family protein phosphatase [Streptomyces zingiberis]